MPRQTDIVYQTPEYPRQLRTDTSTFCNAKCLSCHRLLTARQGILQLSQLDALLSDVARWKVPLSEIIPVNYGEFFAFPGWLSILEAISSKLPQTQITIPTNGSLLNADNVDQLCKVATVRLVNFSVNAYFEETYEKFMGLPVDTIQTIIRAVARIKVQRPDIKTWASMVFDPSYQSDLERDSFKEFWKTKVDAVWTIGASSAGRPDKKVVISRSEPCRSIFSDIVVGYDGKLSSCCWDSAFSLDLGYYSGDLQKDWRNPKLEELRRIHNEHRRNEISLCSQCTSA